MSKSLPRISTDNKLTSRLYTYEVLKTPTSVYVDPLLPDTFQKCVYVESNSPIPVKQIENNGVVNKIVDKIKVNAKTEEKK